MSLNRAALAAVLMGMPSTGIIDLAASGAGSLVNPYYGYGETGALVVAAIKALALFFTCLFNPKLSW